MTIKKPSGEHALQRLFTAAELRAIMAYDEALARLPLPALARLVHQLYAPSQPPARGATPETTAPPTICTTSSCSTGDG
jgi:hypothetical protein